MVPSRLQHLTVCSTLSILSADALLLTVQVQSVVLETVKAISQFLNTYRINKEVISGCLGALDASKLEVREVITRISTQLENQLNLYTLKR